MCLRSGSGNRTAKTDKGLFCLAHLALPAGQLQRGVNAIAHGFVGHGIERNLDHGLA
jgi:hypothetical protein